MPKEIIFWIYSWSFKIYQLDYTTNVCKSSLYLSLSFERNVRAYSQPMKETMISFIFKVTMFQRYKKFITTFISISLELDKKECIEFNIIQNETSWIPMHTT
jgi:hypothetical protein